MKKLEKLLKRYDQINDFILFGSAVKGKEMPNDIDLAIIMDKKDLNISNELKKELEDYKVHLDLISSSSLLKTKLSLNLFNKYLEGAIK